ncbi:MAG: acyl-CoA dehydrogenase family protein [Chloroflexota bacterium]|nr:acyl-CoA dehydrogenase family protein [Chloroflexota bacterium]
MAAPTAGGVTTTEHIAIEELNGGQAKMVRALARQFVDSEIIPIRQQIDDDRDHTKFIEPIFRKLMVELGAGASLTGDQPVSLTDQMGFLEELSRGDSGIAVAIACTGWCLFPVRVEPYRRPDLIEELNGFFPKDEAPVGCFAMTEPEGGCDIENPRMEGRRIHTTAQLDGEEWVINGVKQ